MEREKRTVSGNLLEIDIYPVFESGRKLYTRAPKIKASTEAQKKYNKIQAVKKFIRLINANFTDKDYFMHPTYSPDFAPATEDAARRDMVNFLRRVKRKRASELKKMQENKKELIKAINNMPENQFLKKELIEIKNKISMLSKPFKYAYVIESTTYKQGVYAGTTSFHFHLFLTGGLSDKVLEGMWKKGVRVNCDNYQPESFGPEAAARYMLKSYAFTKKYVCSRNMNKPKTLKIRDGKISRAEVARIASERVDDAAYWEKKYKGYKFIRCYARYNEYNGHWYISTVMFKGNASVTWGMEEWLTSEGA